MHVTAAVPPAAAQAAHAIALFVIKNRYIIPVQLYGRTYLLKIQEKLSTRYMYVLVVLRFT